MVSNTVLSFLGIDVSKKSFNAALLDDNLELSKKFSNDESGFLKLKNWLDKHVSGGIHVCMEATGRYYESLAQFLYSAGYKVSVVNPTKIKGFAQAELKRAKTDELDANLIGRFCQKHRPGLWVPLSPELREMQESERYLDSLKNMRQQEMNRLESGVVCEQVCKLIKSHIEQIDANIAQLEDSLRAVIQNNARLNEHYKLITSVIGVGNVTAFTWLGELGYMDNFQTVRQLESFAGLCVRKRQSGTSVRGRQRLSKVGNSQIRKALFMPAMCAMQYNPAIRVFCQRLRERGKPPKVIVGAVMRKLLRIIFAIVKSKQPFDPEHLSHRLAQPLTN